MKVESKKMEKISDLTVHRLVLYRKLLKRLMNEGQKSVYSYKLATMAGRTPAQVRRDLMEVGYFGTPVHGYSVEELKKSIDDFIDHPQGQEVAIIGLGNLGRAILDYCRGLNPKLNITVAFDKDPKKVDRIINGCKCYHIDKLVEVIREKNIKVAILSIPADDAQSVADGLVEAGIKAILNYSPGRLYIPENIYVENRDMMLALEKAAFFAKIIEEGKSYGKIRH